MKNKKVLSLIVLSLFMIAMKQVLSTCTDTDGGMVVFIYGEVTDPYGTYIDMCGYDEELMELFCNGGYVDVAIGNCTDYGLDYYCTEGVCTNCEDSDGGYDLLEFGTVHYIDDDFDDYCLTSHIIREYECSDGTVSYTDTNCEGYYGAGYECVGGECVLSGCIDTDGGVIPMVYGEVTDPYGTYEDMCSNVTGEEDILMEVYCSGGLVDVSTNNCTWFGGEGYICYNGVCSLPPINCTDSDGTNYFNKGYVVDTQYIPDTVWDACENNITLWEMFCGEYGVDSIEKQCSFFGPSYICYDGACVLRPTNCTDSDDVDYWAKGYATYVPTEVDYWDICYSSTRVEEFMCSGEAVDSIIFDCTYGGLYDYVCIDGRCSERQCNDSDGGINLNLKGIVSQGTISFSDYCVGSNNLNEYYCENNTMSLVEWHHCPAGCKDGACISLSPVNPDTADSDSPWYRDSNDTLHFNGTICVNEGWKSMIMCAGWKYSTKQVVKGTAWVFSGIHILYFLVILILIIIIGPLIVEFFKKR